MYEKKMCSKKVCRGHLPPPPRLPLPTSPVPLIWLLRPPTPPLSLQFVLTANIQDNIDNNNWKLVI